MLNELSFIAQVMLLNKNKIDSFLFSLINTLFHILMREL